MKICLTCKREHDRDGVRCERCAARHTKLQREYVRRLKIRDPERYAGLKRKADAFFEVVRGTLKERRQRLRQDPAWVQMQREYRRDYKRMLVVKKAEAVRLIREFLKGLPAETEGLQQAKTLLSRFKSDEQWADWIVKQSLSETPKQP